MDLKTILSTEPSYRLKQIEKAWFDVGINSYDEITTLPADLREKLKTLPWLSLAPHTIHQSQQDNTRRILFRLHDGKFIETVLMGRKNLKTRDLRNHPSPLLRKEGSIDCPRLTKEGDRGWSDDRYTICISSEVGCPMRCVFCATGRSGFKRNLSAEEIIDQYRYCQRVLAKENTRVNNIVVMGQGEPLLNYENLKKALQVLLKNTDLGETKITVSTAGIPAVMNQLLEDKDFPKVRWAVSLHSAIEETRQQIMPSHKKDFLNFLVDWTNRYREKIPSRTHFIGLEYIMLHGINDDDKHLKALIKLAKRMPHIRINIIPFNDTNAIDPSAPPLRKGRSTDGKAPVDAPSLRRRGLGGGLTRSASETIDHWHQALMAAGFTSTIRYSQGQDIYAACGQLENFTSTNLQNKESSTTEDSNE